MLTIPERKAEIELTFKLVKDELTEQGSRQDFIECLKVLKAEALNGLSLEEKVLLFNKDLCVHYNGEFYKQETVRIAPEEKPPAESKGL